LVAVSYDATEVLARFAQRRGIEFELLSDPGSATIKAYGILNEAATGKTAGIPHPMTFLVGPDGLIKARLGHEGYQTRHTVQQLIEAAKQSVKPSPP